MPKINDNEIDLDKLQSDVEKIKRIAETMLQGVNITDIKIRNSFCKALNISTFTYTDVVRDKKPIHDIETAIKILLNWNKLSSIEPEPEKTKKLNFKQMAKITSQGAGKI